jgi:hypothetical protein
VRAAAVLAVAAAAVAAAAPARASAPPVGPLPAGPLATIATTKGELVAFALPHRSGGRVWRVARAIDPPVLSQVSEADVGPSVVLVFRARRTGTVTVAFGLTKGETSKALESRRFRVQIR